MSDKSPFESLSVDESIQKLQSDLIELESRLSALEKAITGEISGRLWGVPPSSLEDRVTSLEQLVKSKPWEVRGYPYFNLPIEDRVSRIEEQLGIKGSRLWNP